jgi:hypothetical protein
MDMLPGTRPSFNKWMKPDTAIPEWFEVKGRELSSDRSKRKRMEKHYPEVELTVIGRAEYSALKTVFKPLLGELWE